MAAATVIGPSEMFELGVSFPAFQVLLVLGRRLLRVGLLVDIFLPLSAAPEAAALLFVCDLFRLRDFRFTLPVVVVNEPALFVSTTSLALAKAKTVPMASDSSASASPLPSVLMSTSCVASASMLPVAVRDEPASNTARVVFVGKVSATTGVTALPPLALITAVVSSLWVPVAASFTTAGVASAAPLSIIASVTLPTRFSADRSAEAQTLAGGAVFDRLGDRDILGGVGGGQVERRAVQREHGAVVDESEDRGVDLVHGERPRDADSGGTGAGGGVGEERASVGELVAGARPALVRSIAVPAAAFSAEVASLILPSPAWIT